MAQQVTPLQPPSDAARATQRNTLPSLIARHAEDAAFYWLRRMAGVRSSLHDLGSLTRFDNLLEANLEGLRVAQAESGPADSRGRFVEPGNAGWKAVWPRVTKWKTADEAFVAGVLALEAAHAGYNRPYLDLLQDAACDQFEEAQGQHEHEIARGLASAAAWLPWPVVEHSVLAWASSHEPVLRRCALSASVLQRLPPGDSLHHWAEDSSALVRVRALRAVGEVGDAKLAPLLTAAVRAPQDLADPFYCRAWAAWSLCLLGRREGCEPLITWHAQRTEKAQPFDAWAALAQVMPQTEFDSALQSLLTNHPRDALTAMRYSGEARWIDTLLSVCVVHLEPQAIKAYFDEPRRNLARLAADVIAHITGCRIGDNLWMHAPEEPEDENAAADNPAISVAKKSDPDHGLQWPDLAKLSRWWTQNRARFSEGEAHAGRYIAGAPLTPEHARQVLASASATQLQRNHAAFYLRCTQQTPTLFDVYAPLVRQRIALAALQTPK